MELRRKMLIMEPLIICNRQIDEARQAKMNDIQYFLTAGYFPVDLMLHYWVSYVLAFLPEKDLTILIDDLQITVVQICANTVMKYSTQNDEEVTFICFTSDLCNLDESKIVYIIAHEFAHAFLGHDGTGSCEIELQTDQKVIDWGFEKELRESEISYIFAHCI